MTMTKNDNNDKITTMININTISDTIHILSYRIVFSDNIS